MDLSIINFPYELPPTTNLFCTYLIEALVQSDRPLLRSRLCTTLRTIKDDLKYDFGRSDGMIRISTQHSDFWIIYPY